MSLRRAGSGLFFLVGLCSSRSDLFLANFHVMLWWFRILSSGILYSFCSSFVTSQSLRYCSSVKCSVPSKVIPMEYLFISFFSPRNDSAQCHSIWSNSPYFIASPFFFMNICVLHCLLVGLEFVFHDSTLWRTMNSFVFVPGVYLHSFISLSNIVCFVLEIKQKLSLVSILSKFVVHGM